VDNYEIENDRGESRYERTFFPFNDEALLRAGVEIVAVTRKLNERIKNEISFIRDDKKSTIECIHVAIANFVFNEEGVAVETGGSTERLINVKEYITIEDAFFSLVSFVQALVERGMQQALIDGLRREMNGEDPIDMNHLMRTQLAKALVEIAPRETKELSFFLMEYLSAGIADRFRFICEDFLDLICDHFDEADLRRLDEIGGIENLDYRIKERLASRRDVPSFVLEKLARDVFWRVKIKVISNPSVNQKVLESFLNDECNDARRALASCNMASASLLNRLSSDLDPTVRKNVASNPNTSVKTLMVLSNDNNIRVRRAVARNENVNASILKALSMDPSEDVRRAVAGNPKTTIDILELLLGDEDEITFRIAANRLKATVG